MENTDEFRKMADKFYKLDDWSEEGIAHLVELLRTAAEKYEKIGWNKAVEECVRVANGYRDEVPLDNIDDAKDARTFMIVESIRRLKKSGKE